MSPFQAAGTFDQILTNRWLPAFVVEPIVVIEVQDKRLTVVQRAGRIDDAITWNHCCKIIFAENFRIKIRLA